MNEVSAVGGYTQISLLSLRIIQMPSIIIPAHNEATVIERTLRAILEEDAADLEIIIVVNATTDRTAEIARALDPRIKVIETTTPGKTNALNLGETSLTSFPRIYLDADIELKPGSVMALLNASGAGNAIVSPKPSFDLTDCTVGIRLFMSANRFNHYFGRGAPNGSGCFVLTEEARSRWGEFPDLIADDGFVDGHFDPDESQTIEDAVAIVGPPRDLESMIRVRARVRRGTFELARLHPKLMKKLRSQVGGAVGRMMVRPWTWPALVVYTWVRIRERQLAHAQIARGETGWGRDESARVG